MEHTQNIFDFKKEPDTTEPGTRFDYICALCKSKESEKWWKCCPEHTTEHGRDVLCNDCARKLHPNYFQEVIDATH